MNMSKPTSRASQQSWQIHPSLCKLTFENKSYPIQLESRTEEEPFQSHTPQREFVPLTA